MSQSVTDEGNQSKGWVDFKLIKEAVTMEMLLVQYGIADVVRRGNEVRGACPFHNSKSKTSFSVNLEKNTFCCFANNCKARGNVLDFVAKMEDCTIKDAALKLDEMFKITEQERNNINGGQVVGREESNNGVVANSNAVPKSNVETNPKATPDAAVRTNRLPATGYAVGDENGANQKPQAEIPDHAALVKKVVWLEKQLAMIETRLFYVEVENGFTDS